MDAQAQRVRPLSDGRPTCSVIGLVLERPASTPLTEATLFALLDRFVEQGGTLRLISYSDGKSAAFQNCWPPRLPRPYFEEENAPPPGSAVGTMWERAHRERCMSRLDKLCGEHTYLHDSGMYKAPDKDD